MNQLQQTNKNTQINPWLLVGRVLFTLALVGTTGFIFSNSLAIAEVSNAASGQAQSMLFSLLDAVGLGSLQSLFTMHVIRKLAHFAEFALLGFWWMLCLRVYTRHWVRQVSWPVLACLLTALLDETIQVYSSGRSSQLSDVWLDFAGALAGLLCGLLLLCLCRMIYILVKYRDKE